MTKEELYNISDGDLGSTVAAGLKKNFEDIIDSMNNASKDFATKTEVSAKVDKVEGKALSTNDYTNEDKSKLDSLNNYDDTALKERVSAVETSKQDKTDQSLQTSDKTVSGAINEVKSGLDSIESSIGDVSEILRKINNEQL